MLPAILTTTHDQLYTYDGLNRLSDYMPRTILHVAEILAWADEHFARTGKLPNADSGIVAGTPDEKWVNLDQALRKGLRGFPGGCSLAQLFAEYRGHRNRKRLPRYTVKGILQWADAYKKRTGRWPRTKDGPIPEAPGETWLAVEMALNHGQRGLPGGSSLAQLLAEHRSVRHRTTAPRLSVDRVLAWANIHRRRTGTWPTSKSGTITESGEETWCAINRALMHGRRGLSGGGSLARLLSKHFGVRRHVRRSPLSFQQILRWADAHKKRHGRWPKEKGGQIHGVPGETWLQIQAALRQGKRSLPSGWSLAKLLAKHRGVRNVQDLPQLSVRRIQKWIKEYCRRHGQPPTRDSGSIPKANGETWCAIDLALKRGTRGLPGGSSLTQLMKIKYKRFQVKRKQAIDR